MAEPEFEVRSSVLVGDTAEVGFHRGMTILRNEGINPVVSVEFTPVRGGVLCGILEVKALLGKVLPRGNREVWALEDGATISSGEVVLRVTAPYGSFGLYETAICGILSQCSGWATASNECVTAAGGIPVICIGARHVHPNVAAVMDYAAVVGGCVSCSTILGAKLSGTTPAGTLPPNVALIMGDSTRAMQAFDKHMPQEVSRIAPVNVLKDETEEALGLARALRQRLRGIILDGCASGESGTPRLVKEVRARLDLAGYSHVEILVSGDLNPEIIRGYVAQGAPVNAFEVAGHIGTASPIQISADIHEVDGKPVAKRGRIPGITPNPRLGEIM
ncbi:MAG: nicotinate phosphoribosyltransferase [Chloroflexi bacterium]|nr:nicotinate phosphoribosyltransferase [Chloroflexota bacterium]